MTPSLPSFYVTGGTLRPDSPSYVERRADRELLETLLKGEFCYILTSRQMGKSSLMVRTAQKLREHSIHVVVLDLTAIGQNLTPEQWYDGLLVRTSRQLGLDDKLDIFWQGNQRLGPLQRFFAALREVALERLPGKLVIFVDELDVVRSLPFSTDEFFAAIRECYTRRTEDPELDRLTFCLLGVATPTDLVRDPRITPFNIGKRIELNDFSDEEAQSLAAGLTGQGPGGPDAQRLLHRIFHWTNGHPYLTQRLCYTLATANHTQGIQSPDQTVDSLCDDFFFSDRARERDDNLIFVRERILRNEGDKAGLLDLYLKIRRGRDVMDDETNRLVSLLRLSGIVRAADGALRVRNRIYERAFDAGWVQANMPDAELNRQRAAFRRGVLRTAAIAGVVLFAIALLAFYAAHQAKVAREASARAEAALKTAETKAVAETEAKANEAAARREAERLYEDASAALNRLVGNPERITAINNLRLTRRSADRNEAWLVMDYSYDGLAGASAQLLPVIGKRGDRRVSGWFGADSVTLGRGQGTVTINVKYFSDESGVPPACVTDQIRMLILDQKGTTILAAVPFLKTIQWGNSNAPPAEPGDSLLTFETKEVPAFQMAEGMKTRILNVDLVRRSTDRTQTTIGVDFEYRDSIPDPMLGVDLFRESAPEVGQYFSSSPIEIGKARRNFVLIPISFQPPATMLDHGPESTDQVLVYLSEKSTGRRYNLFRAPMLLAWRPSAIRDAPFKNTVDTVEIDQFKQNDASTGYVRVRYNRLNERGSIHAKIYDLQKPETAAYFTCESRLVEQGQGAEMIHVSIESESKSPTDFVHADTISVELLDLDGKVVARTSKQFSTVWLRPKRHPDNGPAKRPE